MVIQVGPNFQLMVTLFGLFTLAVAVYFYLTEVRRPPRRRHRRA